MMSLKTFQTKIVEKSQNIWKSKLRTENVDSTARVAASKNRYSWVESVYWSYRCQEIPVEIMQECAGGSTIQLNLLKESSLISLQFKLSCFYFITRRGRSMLPTMKTSSRWGCQTALNGVSHRPVKLLWYIDFMPVIIVCLILFKLRSGSIWLAFTFWFCTALLDIVQLQGVIGTSSQGVLPSDGREKSSMNSFGGFRKTNNRLDKVVIICRRVSHIKYSNFPKIERKRFLTISLFTSLIFFFFFTRIDCRSWKDFRPMDVS